MRANVRDIILAKKRVELLRGEEITLKVNEGRNKFVRYNGAIRDMYEGIFTVEESETGKVYSYPYADLITKNVKFLKKA